MQTIEGVDWNRLLKVMVVKQMVVDAYALIGDTAGLAEKIQSFFMQEVISETHSVLKAIVHEDEEGLLQNSRFTYSDLCLRIPDSKFRQCLLRTLAVLFDLMCSYHEIMDFQLERKDTVQNSNKCNEEISCSPGEAQEVDSDVRACNNSLSSSGDILHVSSSREESASMSSLTETSGSPFGDSHDQIKEAGKEDSATSSFESPWYHLRKEAITFVSQILQRGRRNLWHLTASRVSVLLSSAAVFTASIHQFLKNYEELSVFILTGEAFCGIEAVEFRQKLKALKMVLEKETWQRLPLDTVQMISFAGLIGDGAPLISLSTGKSINISAIHSHKSVNMVHTGARKNGFSHWIKSGNPFMQKLPTCNEGHGYSQPNGSARGESDGSWAKYFHDDRTPRKNDSNQMNGANSVSEDEDEDLLADFIDEDSQLPSRSSKHHSRNLSSHGNDEENTTQTGSSLCLLKEYANYRLRTALSRVNQDCEEWIKSQSSSPTSLTSSFVHTELTPINPPNTNFGSGTSLGLKYNPSLKEDWNPDSGMGEVVWIIAPTDCLDEGGVQEIHHWAWVLLFLCAQTFPDPEFPNSQNTLPSLFTFATSLPSLLLICCCVVASIVSSLVVLCGCWIVKFYKIHLGIQLKGTGLVPHMEGWDSSVGLLGFSLALQLVVWF
ncbi:unnamed protein product [Sphenostylis stenocarpa]|uniref:Vacuolar protein sorting-associated protein 54 N-terminal domain-containing protein n=1 Tax=Sphenostylis stenocarpa TaxID=92480 RepID=A0AA86W5W2_9FABA|nr:unnamed protein product [Sphenostylis stenocarpa]